MIKTNKKKFLVLYLVPASVVEDWSKTDPEKRKPAEEKMRAEWNRRQLHNRLCWASTLSARFFTAPGGLPERFSSPFRSSILSPRPQTARSDAILAIFIAAQSR